MSSNLNMSNYTFLLQVEKQQRDYIHISFVSTLIAIGTIGNLHAFVVYLLYFKPSNKRTFIMWLSWVDLLNCVLIFPFSIYTSISKYTVTSDAVCKIFYYLGTLLAGYSLLLLDVVAVERFRKIVFPLNRGTNNMTINRTCTILLLVSVIFCVPLLITKHAGLKEFSNGLVGSWCTNRIHSKEILILVRVYSILMLTSFILFCFVLIILYSIVIIHFRKQDRHVNNEKKGSNIFHLQINDSHLRVSSINSIRQATFRKAKKSTMIFLVASLISCAGYLPNFTITIYSNFSSDLYNYKEPSIRHLLISLSFLNNVINPIVYCFMDKHFRPRCKSMYARILHSCKR